MPRKEKSIEDLLKAVNDASSQARNMWLTFLGLLTYLVVALASITDRALLLNEQIKLPVIDVQISINAFFVFGPVLLLVLHLGILVQHVMLARKLHEFNEALNDHQFINPIRAQVHSYVLSQLAAGPERSKVLDGAMRLMVNATLKWFGLVVLIYFLIALLPLHNVGLAYWLRGVFVTDFALVWIVGQFLAHPDAEFSDNWKGWWSDVRPESRPETGMYACALILVFLVATVPDEEADWLMANTWMTTERSGRPVFFLTAWLLEGEVNPETGERTSPFSRNLDLRNFDFRVLIRAPDGRKISAGEKMGVAPENKLN